MLPCIPNFLDQLAIDLGVTEVNREKVSKKLNQTYAFYLTQTSGESLTSLIDKAQRVAVQEFALLEASVEDALRTFIISAVIAVLVLSLFGYYFIRYITDSLWMWIVLLFVILAVCALLYYLFYRRIQEELALFSRRIEVVYDDLVVQVQAYITNEEAALLNSICYYGNIP